MNTKIVEKIVKSAIARLETISQVGGGVNLTAGLVWMRTGDGEANTSRTALQEEDTLR